MFLLQSKKDCYFMLEKGIGIKNYEIFETLLLDRESVSR